MVEERKETEIYKDWEGNKGESKYIRVLRTIGTLRYLRVRISCKRWSNASDGE